ncbi:MAG TPA: hypothetical protein VFK31_02985 [Rhodanobacteraceae bacterium]|nr:hypothetical protein [Rhodanobacteraceae bacterium]HET8554453.1 hypothetical protein [Rhodanobacteraceae bacterium]
MHRFRCTLIVFCLSLLALPGLALAAGSTSDGIYSQDNGFNPKMLDASVPQAERLKLFSHVIALATQGKVRAQNLAGTMYWQGSNIPGSPIQSNLQQAHILLANAAVHGDVLAMAKLAEMEFKSGHLQKAMIWAQLYAHYIDPMVTAREHHGYRYAYASDLISRISKAGGKINDAVSKGVGATVARFDKPIREGISTFKHQRRSGDAYLTAFPQGKVPNELRTKSGVAEFMVAFDTSGKPGNVWLIASYPTPDFGAALRTHLDHVRANPVSADTGTRYLLVAIPHYSVNSRELRAHH